MLPSKIRVAALGERRCRRPSTPPAASDEQQAGAVDRAAAERIGQQHDPADGERDPAAGPGAGARARPRRRRGPTNSIVTRCRAGCGRAPRRSRGSSARARPRTRPRGAGRAPSAAAATGARSASRMTAAKTGAAATRRPAPTSSKIVARERRAELDRQRRAMTSATGGPASRAIPRAGRVAYGFSRCPVRNSHALQATMAAASAAVTASDEHDAHVARARGSRSAPRCSR